MQSEGEDSAQTEVERRHSELVTQGAALDTVQDNDNVQSPLSPSLCERRYTIAEKRRMAKENLELQAKKMTKSSCDKFPPANVGDTIKLRVPDIDRGRCDPRSVMGVVTAVDGDKGLYKIGTKFGAINTTYTRNQFTTCTEKIVAAEDVPDGPNFLESMCRQVFFVWRRRLQKLWQ